jgi:hypothetical protein
MSKGRVFYFVITILLFAYLALSPTISADNIDKEKRPATFTRDVAPILFKNCAECHRPGEIAPFSVMSYRDVRPWAKSIREKVVSREMPPWSADPRHGEFLNDPSMAQSEIDAIVAWVDGGAKEGNARDLPPAPKFAGDWEIGAPDLVLAMPEEFTLDARGADDYIYFRVPTGFTEDKWIQAAEFRPGNKRVVHHAVIFVETPQMVEAAKAQAERAGKVFDPRTASSFFDRAPGPSSLFYKEGTVWRMKPNAPVVDDACNAANARSASAQAGSYILSSYAPGRNADTYPQGTAKRIPAGSNLIFQMHYAKTTGRVEKDRTSVALVFAKGPVEKTIETLTVVNSNFAIPPGAENHRATACYTLPHDIELINYFPHMHVRGKDMKYEVIYPDGRSETLISVKYDFNWQTLYKLKNPVPVPKGSRIAVTAHFDNSAKNRFNPDPAKTVRFGEPTYDEMLVGYADFTRKARTVAKLDPKLLDRYAGRYQAGNGMNFTVSLENGKLYVTAPGFGRNEMFPETETRFFINFADAQVTFVKDGNGEANEIIFEVNRQTIRAKRIEKAAAEGTNR